MPQPIIVLTRPPEGSASFARALADLDAQIVIAPLQDIRPNGVTPELEPRDVLIFTSSAAIGIAAQQGILQGREVYVVGRRSGELARAAGAHVVKCDVTAQAVADHITAQKPSARCHYLHGKHISFDFEKHLISAGLETVSTEIYEQVELPPSPDLLRALDGDVPVILPLFSVRSAAILARTTTGRRSTAAMHAISISAAVDATLTAASMTSRLVAASPDADAMMQEIRALVAALD